MRRISTRVSDAENQETNQQSIIQENILCANYEHILMSDQWAPLNTALTSMKPKDPALKVPPSPFAAPQEP